MSSRPSLLVLLYGLSPLFVGIHGSLRMREMTEDGPDYQTNS